MRITAEDSRVWAIAEPSRRSPHAKAHIAIAMAVIEAPIQCLSLRLAISRSIRGDTIAETEVYRDHA